MAAAIPLESTADARRAREHALVLEAMAIPHELRATPDGWVLLVPPQAAPRAYEQLRAYDRENAGGPRDDSQPTPLGPGVFAAALYALALVLVHRMQGTGAFGVDWTGLGRTEADAIRGGALWRAVTALTLHGDAGHLVGNLVFGIVFAAAACNVLGVPVGGCAILLAGFGGNLLNAAIRSAPHTSIGSSTAIFGALGIVVAHRWRRRTALRHRRVSRWAPPVLGAVLLGWLGGSGDVLAHLAGFLCGLLLGALLGGRYRPRRLSRAAAALLCAAPPLAVALCWAWALATR